MIEYGPKSLQHYIPYYFDKNNNEEEPIMIKKSMQEIEFDEYKAKVDREIEEKRLALLEEQRMAKAHEEAAGYWYFYRGLLDSGFTEEQAMQILLAKEGK